MDYSQYKSRIGKRNVERSEEIITEAPVVNDVPYVIHAAPQTLPLDIDPIFTGCPYDFQISLTSSIAQEIEIEIEGYSEEGLELPKAAFVNQSRLLPVRLTVPENHQNRSYCFNIHFTAQNISDSITFSFSPIEPRATIALDLTHHTNIWNPGVYASYSAYYGWLKSEQIGIYEIRNKSQVTHAFLSTFDAVIIDDFIVANASDISSESLIALKAYYKNGGNIGVFPNLASSNISLLNSMLNWTGISFHPNKTKGVWNATAIHPITDGIEIPSGWRSLNGVLISHNDTFQSLAAQNSMNINTSLIVSGETPGRFLTTGFGGIYDSNTFGNDSVLEHLAIRITWWLCDLL
ncbi:MAG: hypothetical protein ACOC38_05520 [Promethearchaeia archaeon]